MGFPHSDGARIIFPVSLELLESLTGCLGIKWFTYILAFTRVQKKGCLRIAFLLYFLGRVGRFSFY